MNIITIHDNLSFNKILHTAVACFWCASDGRVVILAFQRHRQRWFGVKSAVSGATDVGFVAGQSVSIGAVGRVVIPPDLAGWVADICLAEHTDCAAHVTTDRVILQHWCVGVR